MLERLRSAVDGSLRDHQAGFRQARSCADQIATLRIIVEQSIEWNSSLYINFVDYQKAFDSLDRPFLWKLLAHYGIPQKFINIIKNSYEGTSCKVIHEGQLSESFEVKTGVRQGCLLSPFLFLLAIDWIMKSSTTGHRNGIQWTLTQQLDDLDYADDIALLSHSGAQMQNKTTILEERSRRAGLVINTVKTKVLKINSGSNRKIRVNDADIEEVDSFTYLGSVVDTSGGTDADVANRINKARGAFHSLKQIWSSGSISTSTKLKIFNSNVKICAVVRGRDVEDDSQNDKKVTIICQSLFASNPEDTVDR